MLIRGQDTRQSYNAPLFRCVADYRLLYLERTKWRTLSVISITKFLSAVMGVYGNWAGEPWGSPIRLSTRIFVVRLP
jgi:hypothetical protein